MNKRRTLARALAPILARTAIPGAALLLAAAWTGGCATGDLTAASPEGAGLDGGVTGQDASGAGPGAQAGGGAGAGGCVATPPKPEDPSSLPNCCEAGAAHCVASADVPSADKPALAMCSGGYCVPDPFITNPSYVPPACTAFNRAPGVCLSLCVPQVAQYKAILTQASCAATELCAPCVNPLTNQPSGACAFAPPSSTTCGAEGGTSGAPGDSDGSPGGSGGAGDGAAPEVCPYTGPPLIDPTTLPGCGTAGGAHCLQAALVPAAMQAQLATCSGGYCVPDVFAEAGGNFIPPTCSSLDGAEGRCLNLAIPAVASQASQLEQASCQAFERCAPCFSPIDGASTGACNLSCDPGPTRPIVLFPSCCKERGADQGRCVPAAIIPSSERSNLGPDVCARKADLCVPSEMLSIATFRPPTCAATGFLVGSYAGVCLSNCLSFGIQGLALAQGTCDGEHTCAPCTNPLTGQPSGAPGCP